MLIVWGKRAVHDDLGYVADRCPLCRALRAFRFRRLGSASHVYFISIPGEDSLVGYTRTCMECNSTFGAVPDTYRSISKELREPEALLTETFPNYYDVYGALIALERKTPSQLTPEERRDRLTDPVFMIAEGAQPRFSHIKMDRGSWYGVGAFAFVLLGLPAILNAASLDVDEQPGLILVPAFAALATMIITFGFSGNRYTVSWALPRLARALAGLRPTDSELEDLLRALRDRNLMLGSKLRVSDLQKAIEVSRQTL